MLHCFTKKHLSAPLLVVGLSVLASVATSAQAPPDPVFEVASIKPNKSGSNRVNLDLQPGGRFIAINAGLPGLISVAYGDPERLPANRISISPRAQWIQQRSNTFDIEAKAAGELTRRQLTYALRALLVNRFKFVVHYDTKELPMYALVLARTDGRLGPGLRRSNVDCSDLQRHQHQLPTGRHLAGSRAFRARRAAA